MSDDTVISVKNVSKAYRIWNSPGSRLTAPIMESAADLFPANTFLSKTLKSRAARRYRDFWALKDINFEVKRGESVGIIGRNGSGKSSLLQIIAGTLQPSAGTAKIAGRVAALLELGSGFNPEFTGRENIFLNGAILGLGHSAMESRLDEIIAFADIGDFLDQPVKTYSSGMVLRLAFSVQTAVEPDILIIDEALSVGDFFFQQKCAARMRGLRDRGTTLLFVSHDMGSVRDLCARALYLKQGHQVDYGESQQAISLYLREETPASNASPQFRQAMPVAGQSHNAFLQEIRRNALWTNADHGLDDPASAIAQFISVHLLDEGRQPIINLIMGRSAIIQAFIMVRCATSLHVALEIKNRRGQLVSSLGSRTSGLSPLAVTQGQILKFEAIIEWGLEAGEYSLQAVIGLPDVRPNIGTRIDTTPWLGPITIKWDYENEPAPFLGMFWLPSRINFSVCPTLPRTTS